MAAAMDALPPSLRERLRPITPGTPRPGSHVLYVLRTAFRAEQNPSLEVGLRMAATLDLPLICLAIIEDSFPSCMRADSVQPPRQPTDRCAAFRLEACKELQTVFKQRGTVLLVHVEREKKRPAVGLSLAAKAALVVADEHFGVQPHAAAISRMASVGVPLWLCDTSCTVPSVVLTAAALVGGNAGFLRATHAARVQRLDPGWFPPAAPPPPQPPPAIAPEWSIDLNVDGALESVLAAPSRRDVSVQRVTHTRGGQRAAMARWSAYVSGGGLKGYASHRNNPLAADGKGASRMSAYINAGMVDPYRLARDAVAAGADKFISEFVGFRESAHLWCLLHPGGYMDASVAVPGWARNQLAHVAATPMTPPSLAALEAGHSGDALWDDCQRCLVLSGELHNNVRMAWGKAIPAWHACALGTPVSTSTAATRLQAALDLLIRLNDKFALDGGAPPSYGGLLWCLGWRDRPGKDGCPTPRPTSVMARRIRPGDLERRALWRCGGQRLAASLAHVPAARGEGSTPATAATPILAQAPTGQCSPPCANGDRISTDSCQSLSAVASKSTSTSSGKRLRDDPRDDQHAVRPVAEVFRVPATPGTMWHFLNRESAASLPPGIQKQCPHPEGSGPAAGS